MAGFAPLGLALVLLVLLVKEEVDDAQAAALSLAPRLVRPAQFPEPTRARHNLAGLRVVDQEELKSQQSRVVEIRAEVAREGRRFEELHQLNHTLNAYGFQFAHGGSQSGRSKCHQGNVTRTIPAW